MLHPSYTELIDIINKGVEPGEEPVVQSRYSIVTAAAKRARQIIAGEEAMAEQSEGVSKPLSQAVAELNEGSIKIMTDEEFEAAKAEMEAQAELELTMSEEDDVDSETDGEYSGEENYEAEDEHMLSAESEAEDAE